MLVSEVMLQQTQVSRVLPAWSLWMARWPTIDDLAGAEPSEVIQQWSGMGYNRRAVALHRMACAVVAEYGGAVPGEVDRLQRLPGIGPYTANAVACFAFRSDVAAVDTNVARVLARAILGVASAREAGAARIAAASAAAIRQGDAHDVNLALMDLGATICRTRPDCEQCPLEAQCLWRRAGMPVATSSASPKVPFEQTARFARGRIVEALRSRPVVSIAELGRTVGAVHAPRIVEYLDALEREGLAQRVERGWALPGVRAG